MGQGDPDKSQEKPVVDPPAGADTTDASTVPVPDPPGFCWIVRVYEGLKVAVTVLARSMATTQSLLPVHVTPVDGTTFHPVNVNPVSPTA